MRITPDGQITIPEHICGRYGLSPDAELVLEERPDGVLVDADVLVDVLARDPHWVRWSAETLAAPVNRGDAVVNPIVYAELAPGFPTAAALDAALSRDEYRRKDLPWEAAFPAGQAHLQYRKRGGSRRTPMPDFYVGAHAAIRGHALLTRDVAVYRTYFPAAPLITP